MSNFGLKSADVCIIGSGPSGLFAAFQAGMLGLSHVVIESLESPGGQCAHLYPQKNIYDIPAIMKISGQQLTDTLVQQINQFKTIDSSFLLNQRANFLFNVCCECNTKLQKKHDEEGDNLNRFFENFFDYTKEMNRLRCDFCCFFDKNYEIDSISEKEENEGVNEENGFYLVKTNQNTWILCKSIVIAAGVGSFEPKRIPLSKLAKHEEKSVFYSVKDKEKFKNKKILIIGGGDSALDWCNELADISDVVLVHRRDDFTGVASTLDKILSKITVLKPYSLHDIIETEKNGEYKLDGVCLKNLKTNEMIEQKVDYILAFFGLMTSMGDINNWGLETGVKNRIITSSITAQTSKKMIYAVGDCATNGKVSKLIVSGFDEASQAIHDIYHKLYPGHRIDYSTTKFDK